MSKRNKHGWGDTVTGGISYRFMHDELGPWIPCPKRSCTGTLTDVYVRYVYNGPIFNDKECIECGKVVKDPRTYDYFQDINQQNRDNYKNKGKGRRGRIRTYRMKVNKIEVLTNPRLQGELRHDSTSRKRRGPEDSRLPERKAG